MTKHRMFIASNLCQSKKNLHNRYLWWLRHLECLLQTWPCIMYQTANTIKSADWPPMKCHTVWTEVTPRMKGKHLCRIPRMKKKYLDWKGNTFAEWKGNTRNERETPRLKGKHLEWKGKYSQARQVLVVPAAAVEHAVMANISFVNQCF